MPETLHVPREVALRAIRNLYCLAATARGSGHRSWIDRVIDRLVTGVPNPIRISLGEFIVIPKAVEAEYVVAGEKYREWWHTFKPHLVPTMIQEKLKRGNVEFLGIVVDVAYRDGGDKPGVFQVEIRAVGTLYVSPSRYGYEALRIVELSSRAECGVEGDA